MGGYFDSHAPQLRSVHPGLRYVATPTHDFYSFDLCVIQFEMSGYFDLLAPQLKLLRFDLN